MKATLHGIGVGPGDPELLTLKAARLIQACPVVAYLSADGKPGFARRIANAHCHDGQIDLPILMPMRVSRAEGQAAYDDAAKTIANHLASGRDVAFLCEGDPLFYGSFMYLVARLGTDFPVSIVPGISSPMAAAAIARQPLVARDEVFAAIPATLENGRIEAVLAVTGSVVIMKLGRHLPRIRALLERAGLLAQTLYVERAGTSEQRVMPLSALEGEVAPYFSLLLVTRGEFEVVHDA